MLPVFRSLAGWPHSDKIWSDLRGTTAPTKPLNKVEPVSGFNPDSFARAVHESIWNGDMAAIEDS